MPAFDSIVEKYQKMIEADEDEVAAKYSALLIKDKNTGKIIKRMFFDESTQSFEKRTVTVPPGMSVSEVVDKIN